jgi:hypothetical protein
MCASGFNLRELGTLPTESIYVSRITLTIKSDYFPVQH